MELIQNNMYDCLIVDYMLPDIAGAGFCDGNQFNEEDAPDAGNNLFSKRFLGAGKNETEAICKPDFIKDVNSLDLLLEETVMLLHIDHKELSA